MIRLISPFTGRNALLAGLLVVPLFAMSITPAEAQGRRDGWNRGGGQWHGGHWNHGGRHWGHGGGGYWNRGFVPGLALGLGVAALATAPYYYAPPPVYYAPPPVYYAPPVYYYPRY